MRYSKTASAGMAACVFCLAQAAHAETDGKASEFDYGPLVSRDTDVFGNSRIRALGPIFELRRGAGGGRMFAIRPLMSREDKPQRHEVQADIIWPLFYATRMRKELHWRMAVIVSWLDSDCSDPSAKYRLWILPFLFQGRNRAGENYFAVFPIGGKICDILGNDETMFVLFPVYGYGKRGTMRTWNVFWPLGAWGRGERMERFRAAPFYGYMRRAGQFEKSFVMWPVWTEATYEYPGSAGNAYVIFPLFGHIDLEDQESWLALPPLFRFSTRGSTLLYYIPWPFIQAERGKVNKTYFWPIAGAKSGYNQKSWFMFWPLITAQESSGALTDYSRLWMLPFFYSTTLKEKAGGNSQEPETLARYLKVWPLMSYTRSEDISKLRVLSLLPFKDIERIERNYADLWTIYSRSRNGPDVEDELLWGLAAWRRGAEKKRLSLFPFFSSGADAGLEKRDFSLLCGLFRYTRERDSRRYRLFYFLNWTRGKNPDADEPVESHPGG